MDESYVAASILPVSHAALFGIKCPKFRDSVTMGRKVQMLQDAVSKGRKPNTL